MASHSAVQILASFLGGTAAATAFFKATATGEPGPATGIIDDPSSTDQVLANQDDKNSQYVKQEKIDQIQHSTVAMEGTKGGSKASPQWNST